MPAPLPPAAAIAAQDESSSVSFEAVYDNLKALASRHLARGARGTLDTTALVHEAFLRVQGGRDLSFEHSAQFLSYVARAMRHVLVDRARARMRQKAGGEWARVTFTHNAEAQPALENAEQALALEDALVKLEASDPRAARVIELRFFAGLSSEQTAVVLGLTRRTIDRDWRFARAFLHATLD